MLKNVFPKYFPLFIVLYNNFLLKFRNLQDLILELFSSGKKSSSIYISADSEILWLLMGCNGLEFLSYHSSRQVSLLNFFFHFQKTS